MTIRVGDTVKLINAGRINGCGPWTELTSQLGFIGKVWRVSGNHIKVEGLAGGYWKTIRFELANDYSVI